MTHAEKKELLRLLEMAMVEIKAKKPKAHTYHIAPGQAVGAIRHEIHPGKTPTLEEVRE